MEIPDAIVVNKADHPLADTMIREVRSGSRSVRSAIWRVPVVSTEAAKDEGIAGSPKNIDAHRRHIEETGSPGRAPGPEPPRRGPRARGGSAAAPARGAGRRRTRSGRASWTASCGARPTPPRRPGCCWRSPEAPGAQPALCYRASAAQSKGAGAAFGVPPTGGTITRVRRPLRTTLDANLRPLCARREGVR